MSKPAYKLRSENSKSPSGKNYASHMKSIGAGHVFSPDKKAARRKNESRINKSPHFKALSHKIKEAEDNE